MAGVQGALNSFWTLMNQWKSGHSAELRLFCEGGQLKVNLSANLGSWVQSPQPQQSESGDRCYQSPRRRAGLSYQRRLKRRAAARAATSAAAAEKADNYKVEDAATAPPVAPFAPTAPSAEQAAAPTASLAEQAPAPPATSSTASPTFLLPTPIPWCTPRPPTLTTSTLVSPPSGCPATAFPTLPTCTSDYRVLPPPGYEVQS